MTEGPILVTGAGGFAGTAFLKALARLEIPPKVRAVVHAEPRRPLAATDWSRELDGAEVVVNLAARAHALRVGPEQAREFEENVRAAVNLFNQAALAGARRFVQVGTAGIHGRRGLTRRSPGNEDSPLNPDGPYARAKAEAEKLLRAAAEGSGLELVLLRPVLMYGPGVRGNLLKLMGLLRRGLPWPLAAVDNRRSFLNVDDLAEVLIICLDHPAAAGRAFVLADDGRVSTPELFRRLGTALGIGVRLWPCPTALLRAGAALAGRNRAASQLLDDLCFDNSLAKDLLGWRPVHGLDRGLAAMAADFKENL